MHLFVNSHYVYEKKKSYKNCLDDSKYINNAFYGYVDYWRDISHLKISIHCERSEVIPRLLNNSINPEWKDLIEESYK